MKIKTQDLIGLALDWAVAKCEGYVLDCDERGEVSGLSVNQWNWAPSTDWSQGGPILDREKPSFEDWTPPNGEPRFYAYLPNKSLYGAYGPTHLVAGMRCYVASRLGDEMDVPEELLQ